MNCYILAGQTMGAFIWPELFLFRGAGAGLIRDRPAAALSLSERLADPRCLIGTGSPLTRAFDQQGNRLVAPGTAVTSSPLSPERPPELAQGTPDPLMKEMGS